MSFVLIDQPRPHVTRITLNRPERMNAMAFDVMVPFREALEEVGRDNGTRVVVVTGASTAASAPAPTWSRPGRSPASRGSRSAPSRCARWSCSTTSSARCAACTSR